VDDLEPGERESERQVAQQQQDLDEDLGRRS
jgi:hypothetical protein